MNFPAEWDWEHPVPVARRPEAGVALSVRLTRAQSEALSELAEADGKYPPQLAREVIDAYIAAGGRGGKGRAA